MSRRRTLPRADLERPLDEPPPGWTLAAWCERVDFLARAAASANPAAAEELREAAVRLFARMAREGARDYEERWAAIQRSRREWARIERDARRGR